MSQLSSLTAGFPALEQVFVDYPSGFTDQGTPVGPDNIQIPPVVQGLFKPDAMNPPYRRYLMRVKYQWHENIAILPVAGPPSGAGGFNGTGEVPIPGGAAYRPAARIVRNSAPHGVMAVYWDAVRDVYQPLLPMPTPLATDPTGNAVLAFAEIEGGPTDVTENSVRTWRLQGRYFFYLRQPIWMLDGLQFGATPLHTLQPSDNVVPQGSFRPLI